MLNTALATYLPLKDDELLLAIIDRGGRKTRPRCALTTRASTGPRKMTSGRSRRQTGGTESKRRSRRAKNSLVVRLAATRDLPDQIAAIEGPTDLSASTWAAVTTIELGGSTVGSRPALARYLETMGRAARAGAALEGADRSGACRPGRAGLAAVCAR